MAGDGHVRKSRAPRPYALRRCPDDFQQVYITGGWPAVELEYGARPSVIIRWIEECGGETLRQARARYYRMNGRKLGPKASVAKPQQRGG